MILVAGTSKSTTPASAQPLGRAACYIQTWWRSGKVGMCRDQAERNLASEKPALTVINPVLRERALLRDSINAFVKDPPP